MRHNIEHGITPSDSLSIGDAREVRSELNRVQELLGGDSYEAHLDACRLASTLPSEAFKNALQYLTQNLEDITKRGERDYYAQLDREGYGGDLAYPGLRDYVAQIYAILGHSIQNRNAHEKAVLESAYLQLTARFIEGVFIGDKTTDNNLDHFITHMSRSRVELQRSAGALSAKQGDEWSEQYWEETQAETDEPLAVVNTAFESLGGFGRKKSVEFLTAWLQFYPEANPRLIADTLSRIDPNKAGARVLPLLKNKDEQVREAATRVLYRLELGQVGISSDGVKYLEKIYDLGECNRPDYSVQRLTADGTIGIFDDTQRLVKHFQLEGLDLPEARIKARVLDFTRETLFTTKPNETPENRATREQALKEFQENYFGFYNDAFFKETGVRFNNLSFKEQGQLLLFYRRASEKDRTRALTHVGNYGEKGFRAFLSLEYGEEMGNTILTIGEELTPSVAKRIFQRYSEIVDASEHVRDYLSATWGKDRQYTPIQEDRIVEGLLRKGKELLSEFAKQITTSAGKDTPREQAIMGQLDAIKSEIFLFASTCKVASQEAPLAFEDIKNTSLEIARGAIPSAEDQEEMARIFKDNRRSYPPALLKETLREFQDATTGKTNSEFHLLRHGGAIVSFIRFDKLPNGNLYAGSLNVRPEVRGSAIGSAMLRTALDRAAKTHTVEAVVYEKNPMLKHYVEKFHFRIVGEIPDYKGTGQRYLKLERLAEKKARFPAQEPQQLAA